LARHISVTSGHPGNAPIAKYKHQSPGNPQLT